MSCSLSKVKCQFKGRAKSIPGAQFPPWLASKCKRLSLIPKPHLPCCPCVVSHAWLPRRLSLIPKPYLPCCPCMAPLRKQFVSVTVSRLAPPLLAAKAFKPLSVTSPEVLAYLGHGLYAPSRCPKQLQHTPPPHAWLPKPHCPKGNLHAKDNLHASPFTPPSPAVQAGTCGPFPSFTHAQGRSSFFPSFPAVPP